MYLCQKRLPAVNDAESLNSKYIEYGKYRFFALNDSGESIKNHEYFLEFLFELSL